MPILRPILFILGMLLCALAGAMLLPAAVDAVLGYADAIVFLVSSSTAGFVGVLLVLANGGEPIRLSTRQAFLVTTLGWVAVAVFAALPLLFSELELDFTDAFFEAISGLTTTGSTVLVGLDAMPPGILLWRALLQWIGGIGIIVMAVAILPFLRVGGMQLFQTESSERSEKVLPRPGQVAAATVAVYAALTLLCAAAYLIAGMNGFDAVTHAMTTLSTGGYSTHDASFGFFPQPAVHWLAVVFMLSGSLPFAAYIRTVRGGQITLWRDSQVRAYLAVLAAFVAVLTAWLTLTGDLPFGAALRFVAFNVVSVATTTGYASVDYQTWGVFAVAIFFVLTFVGGCTGSTAGGIKAFRFQILGLLIRSQLRLMIHPHEVVSLRYHGRRIGEDIVPSVATFIFLVMATVGVLSAALAMLGLDLVTSFSAAATAVANVGPGLGPVVGPAGNFAPLPDTAKWLLALGMLLGRLELVTVLVLLSPQFWRP